jgi:hypothetical protein
MSDTASSLVLATDIYPNGYSGDVSILSTLRPTLVAACFPRPPRWRYVKRRIVKTYFMTC